MNFRVCLSFSLSSIFRPVYTHPCMFMLADNVEGSGCVKPNRYVFLMYIYVCDMCLCVCVCVFTYVFYFTCVFVQKIMGRRDSF